MNAKIPMNKNKDLQGTVGEFLKINDLFNDDATYNKANKSLMTAFTSNNVTRQEAHSPLKRFKSMPRIIVNNNQSGRNSNIDHREIVKTPTNQHLFSKRHHSVEKKLSMLASSFNLG